MKKIIKALSELARVINYENSGLYPGQFKDRGTFEAIISKKDYYDNDLEFIIEMYVSLQMCHIFHDGNKRTSLSLFEILLGTINYYVIDIKRLSDLQILFIEKEITKEEFVIQIYKLIEKY